MSSGTPTECPVPYTKTPAFYIQSLPPTPVQWVMVFETGKVHYRLGVHQFDITFNIAFCLLSWSTCVYVW